MIKLNKKIKGYENGNRDLNKLLLAEKNKKIQIQMVI